MSTFAPLAFVQHDHRACRKAAMAAARKICEQHRLRLTPVRRRVLELLCHAHRPMRAYDILQRLGAEGYGSQPPVVYRALEFLVGHGLVHRIERLNAFLACDCPEADHRAKFLICTRCHRVAEFDDRAVVKALSNVARDSGFEIDEATLEVAGVCPGCSDPIA